MLISYSWRKTSSVGTGTVNPEACDSVSATAAAPTLVLFFCPPPVYFQVLLRPNLHSSVSLLKWWKPPRFTERALCEELGRQALTSVLITQPVTSLPSPSIASCSFKMPGVGKDVMGMCLHWSFCLKNLFLDIHLALSTYVRFVHILSFQGVTSWPTYLKLK